MLLSCYFAETTDLPKSPALSFAEIASGERSQAQRDIIAVACTAPVAEFYEPSPPAEVGGRLIVDGSGFRPF